MSRAFRVCLVLVPFLLVPCLAQAGITVWRDKEHKGPSQSLNGAVPDLRRVGFDDQISSMSAEEPWLVCSEPRYRGECRVVEGSVENLHGSGMNDRISSMRPAPKGQARGWRNRDDAVTGWRDAAGEVSGSRPVIRVYAHEDYEGPSQTFDRAIPDLAQYGLARQITSVRVDSGEWQVCSRVNFSGNCRILSGSDDDLDDWSDSIASLRPAGGSGTGAWDDPVSSSRPRIRVYEHEDYQGASQTFDRAVADLSQVGLASQITSVQIESGTWQVCNRAHFQGNCTVLSGNDDDLDDWSDTIVSLRPAGGSGTGSWDDPVSSTRPRIRVYEDTQFAGRSQVFEQGVPDLARFGLARDVMSVRIEGGAWQVCTEENYRGDCTVLRESDDFLGEWGDAIVSLRPASP